MRSPEQKLSEIKKVVDNVICGIKTKPLMWGSIEEIEANFFLLDSLDLILSIEESDSYRELSWRAFLSYKGGFGPRSASAVIREKKYDDPNKELSKLREEYYLWRSMMITSIENPEENELLEKLVHSNDYQAHELLYWFIKHPSKKAMNLYEARIIKEYSKDEKISVALSSMGDINVLKWAITRLQENNKDRNLALKIIGSSPLKDANKIAKEIIAKSDVADIKHLIQGCAYANNDTVYAWIEEIIAINSILPELRSELSFALHSPVHINKKKAIDLLLRMD